MKKIKLLPLIVFGTALMMVSIVCFVVDYGKPSAKELLSSLKLPEMPKELTEESVREILATERSFTLNGYVNLRMVATDNSLTQDYTYEIPVTMTLDIYPLEDGRSAISMESYVKAAVTSPYADDMEGVYEKGYFFIVNSSLTDTDVYMREYNTLASDLSQIDENAGGNWIFSNDRDIDVQAFVDAYNEDHKDMPDNPEVMEKAFGKFGQLLAGGAKVTEEEYEGTMFYTLTTHIDFVKKKDRKLAMEVLELLQSGNDTFKYLNLSEYLEYYGRYIVVDVTMSFIKTGDSYSFLTARVDFSQSRLEKYFTDRYKEVLQDKTDKIAVDIDQLFFEVILLPVVPEEVKCVGTFLDDYTTDKMVKELNEYGNHIYGGEEN